MTQHTATRYITGAADASAIQRFLWELTDTAVLTRRNLVAFQRQPELLLFNTAQPTMMLLLFTYVFGGVIRFAVGGDYINFLLPGILIMTIMFASTNTTLGLSVDLSRGMIDRFRSLPMSRAAVLAGRTIADTVRGAMTVAIMIGVGYLIGFRFDDWGAALLAILIVLAFGHAITWIGATIGLFIGVPESAQVAGFLWIFPLAFASSIFVPTMTMEAWLREFAENQPVSIVASVVRDLMQGTVNPDEITTALFWIIGIIVVFMPVAIWKYSKVASE